MKQVTEEHSSVACLSWGALQPFLYGSAPPAQGWHYPQWAEPSFVSEILQHPFQSCQGYCALFSLQKRKLELGDGE